MYIMHLYMHVFSLTHVYRNIKQTCRHMYVNTCRKVWKDIQTMTSSLTVKAVEID